MSMRLFISLVVLYSLVPFGPVFALDSTVAEATESNLTSPEKADILPADAVFIGEEEQSGVIALAWLYKPPATSSDGGELYGYPLVLFLRFISVENNILLEKGIVADKLGNTSGEKTPAEKLAYKDGYFVGGLDLPGNDYNLLLIGCKLEDEKKRQYQFELPR